VRVSVCVLSYKNDKEGKEKEEKGKEKIAGVSGFSRVLTPLVHSLNRHMSMLSFDLLFSFRILHFKYKSHSMAFH